MPDDDVAVELREEERRYVLLVAGEPAGELVYRIRGTQVMALLHTEVDPNQRRRGLGSSLVQAVLDDARTRGFRVVPICPFVESYMRDHPEYGDLAVSDPARRPD